MNKIKTVNTVSDLILERLAITVDHHLICGQPPFHMRYVHSLRNEVRRFIEEEIQLLLDQDLALKRELVEALKTVKKNCTKEELQKINGLIARAEATL